MTAFDVDSEVRDRVLGILLAGLKSSSSPEIESYQST